LRGEDRQVASVERLLHLRKAPIIGSLPSEPLAAIADAARVRAFQRHAVLLREGEPLSAIHFVIEGEVCLRRGGRVLGHLGPGAAIGGVATLAARPVSLSAHALQDTLTLELDTDTLLDLLDDSFAITRHLLREVSHQIIRSWQALPAGHVVPIPLTPAVSRGRDLDLVERIFFLRQVPTFTRSSINALAELSRALNELRFPAGTVLWKPGDLAQHVCLVVDGTFDCRSTDGRIQFKGVSGTPLGGLEAIAGLPRWYEAVAATPVVTLMGDVNAAFDVFEDNPDMALDALREFSSWLFALVEARIDQDVRQAGADPLPACCLVAGIYSGPAQADECEPPHAGAAD
jgi:CRP-like cAMP-binding protein